MSGPEHPMQTITVKVQLCEPDLVGAAFNMVHTIAKAHEISDVEDIWIDMTLRLRGWPSPYRIEKFKGQIDQLWMASVVKAEADEEKAVA